MFRTSIALFSLLSSASAAPAQLTGAQLTGADLVGRWALDLAVYGDAGCTFGLFTAAIEGPYTLGAAATVPGATRGDFGFASNRWTALTPDMAAVFDKAGCGAGGWQVGVAQDVTPPAASASPAR